MKLKWILLLISLLIFLGPLGTALVMYRDNMVALIIPDVSNIIGEQGFRFEYADCQISLTGSSVLKLRVTNPFNMKLRLNSISIEIYCSDHNVLLGHAIKTAPLDIPAKTSVSIDLALAFTPQGQAHIYNEHLGSDLYMDLKNVILNLSGIEISINELGNHVGPISIS